MIIVDTNVLSDLGVLFERYDRSTASIMIAGLDEADAARVRVRAARHHRSMEEEALEILKAGLDTERVAAPGLAQSIRRRIEPLGGVELEIAPRRPMDEPLGLSE